jgi:protease-4
VTWILDAARNASRLIGNLLVRLMGPAADFVAVTLSGGYPERSTPPQPLWQRVMPLPWRRREESLEALRERLDRIAGDTRVRGVIVRMRDLEAGMATVQSLRDALIGLRRRGKRVVAYLPAADLRTYYLAAAADEIIMAPAGFWRVTGLRSEITFFRQAFDRLGLLPQFDRIAEYKTAADPFMRSGISEHHREVVESVLDALLGEIVDDVARARRLAPEAVRAAIDRAPLTAEAAAAAGLIDAVGYEDELPLRLGGAVRPARVLPWEQARRRLRRPYRWRARTAVIGVVELIGAIVPGESREAPVPFPLLGRHFAGSDTVARAFRAAERARAIRAVVFHVESGGGSALASDLIWREVERVRRTKPVVVFMGNVAGSGGYYVSCGASRIIAQPATLTGSIGVVNGKLTAQGLFERLGLRREVLARGEAATMESAFEPFSDDHLVRIRGEMENIYGRFVDKVAGGRRRSSAEVETVARGRVWTGRQAIAHGLVDELGDFALAVRRASELAGIPAGADVVARTIVPPPSAALPAAGSVGGAPAGGAVDGTLVAGVAGAVHALAAARELAREPGLLLMTGPDGPTWP